MARCGCRLARVRTIRPLRTTPKPTTSANTWTTTRDTCGMCGGPPSSTMCADGGGEITHQYANGPFRIAEKAIPAIDEVELGNR